MMKLWGSSSKTLLLISLCLSLVILFFGSHAYTGTLPSTRIWESPFSSQTTSIKRALVLPTIDIDSIEWIHAGQLDHLALQPFLYCMGDNTTSSKCRLPRTRNGNEAGAYISFVLDQYDDLPDYTVFMHDAKQQWHNDVAGPDQQNMLQHVRWEHVDAMGYVNLRCLLDPGCPVEVTPFEVPEGDAKLNTTRARFLGIYQELFGVSEAEVPEQIAHVCCAQFIVTKAQILKRPKSDYQRLLKWLADSEADGSHSKGWAFEKIWHVIFSMDPVVCPDVPQCRCNVYGWCGPLANGKSLLPVDLKNQPSQSVSVIWPQ